MSANILEFKSATSPIAQFVRIDGAHRRLGELFSTGRLPIRRAVFDASRIQSQKNLVDLLRREGMEIILDTEVAELAARGKFQTHAKNAPWGTIIEGCPLHASFFDGTYRQVNIINWIAKFAVMQNVDTVLAPTHFLADRDFCDWLPIDSRSCTALRQALDQEGGNHIGIDYPVIHAHTAINKAETRDDLIERICDLPVDNVWIRASGLDNEPKPQSAKQILASLYDLQRVGKPIIMDHVDGLMAQTLVAFGGASGIAAGIGERARFDAKSWHKLPKEREKGATFRRATRIPIGGLGRTLGKKELQLLAGAKGGRKYLSCQDPCCAHGVKDMLTDPRQHSAYQATAPIAALSKIPDLNRERHFLEKPLLDAERLARNIKDLNPSVAEATKLEVNLESLKKRMSEHHRKIGKFSDALSLLHNERGAAAPRAKVCHFRVNNGVNRERRDKR